MPPRDRYHHGDLPEALRIEATRQVRESGVHAFSLRSAARGVGVDVSAVYRHYHDKEALLRAIAREGFRDLGRAMHAAGSAAESSEGRLRAVGRAYVRFALAEPQLFRLMFGPFGAGGAEPLFEAGGSVAYPQLLAALEDLRRDGACRFPLDQAATAAWSAVHGLATLFVDGPIPSDDPEARTEGVLDVLVAGLRAAPGGR